VTGASAPRNSERQPDGEERTRPNAEPANARDRRIGSRSMVDALATAAVMRIVRLAAESVRA
jgi:hypothetical protein